MTSSPYGAAAESTRAPRMSTQLEDALAKHQNGRVDEAKSAYLDILQQDPGHRYALLYLGILCLEERRFADAVKLLEQVRDQYPSDVAALWQLAEAYRELGATADVNLTYKELQLKAPETAEACLLFAERFFRLDEPSRALPFARRALVLSPNSIDIRRRLADICNQARESLLRQGKLAEAIAVLRVELELRPNDFDLYRLLCRTLGDAGFVDEALAILKALAAHVAENPPLQQPAPLDFVDETALRGHLGIGSSLPEQEDVDLLFFAMRLPAHGLAQTICSRLLGLFPDSKALLYLSAVVQRHRSLALLQQSRDMMQSLEKTLLSEPQYCLEMGLTHRDQGNIASALMWLNRARARCDVPNPVILYQLGRTQSATGNFAAAAPLLREAISLKPDLAEAYVDLHESLLAEGKPAEAVDAFDTALRTTALSGLRGVHVHPALMSGTADFIATQVNAIRRNIPSIILNSLEKSGSTYATLRLSAGLHMPVHSILLGQFDTHDRAIPQAVANMAKGGAISRQNFYATEEILELFRRHDITELVLQVRDPRQLVLSNLDYIETLYADGSYIPIRSRAAFPEDFFERPTETKIDYLIDSLIARDTGMIQSWIDAQDKWPDLMVHYCTYESMVADPDEFVRDILDFYDIPHEKFDWAAGVERSDARFRKDKVGEWRTIFSVEQSRRAWNLIPKTLGQRFGWSE